MVIRVKILYIMYKILFQLNKEVNSLFRGKFELLLLALIELIERIDHRSYSVSFILR